MSSSCDRGENPSNSSQKKENSITSSQTSQGKSEKPSIVTKVENSNDGVKNNKSSSHFSPSYDPIQDTPKHCNKTTSSKTSRTEANKRNKSGLSAFSPRRMTGSEHIEGANDNLKHPGYPIMTGSLAPSTRYPPHGYNVGGPSNSYPQRGGYYQGQEPSSAMAHPPYDNSNAPGPYSNRRPHASNMGKNAVPGGAYSYGNGRGYYPQGQPRMSQNGPPKPHPSTISPGSSQYVTNNHIHNLRNGHHNMPHSGPANQQRPPSYPPTHGHRGNYQNNHRSDSRGDTGMNNAGPPPPSSYYNNTGPSSVGDYSAHGHSSNSNHYPPNHHPPPHATGSRDPHHPPYGAPDNSYGSKNRYQDHRVQSHPRLSHSDGSNGYMYNLDDNPSYGSHNDPSQSLSYRNQQQPNTHSHSSDSNGNNQSYSSQSFNRNPGRYPPHGSSLINRPRDEEPLNYKSKYNDSNRNINIHPPPSPPNRSYQSDQDLSYRNMNSNSISTSLSSSMDKNIKNSHHNHNHNHRSNTTGFTRTVSSSFEGGASGSGGYGNHLHPNNKSNIAPNSSIPHYPPKEDSYRHDRRPPTIREGPSNHNKDHLPPTSNIAFEQDVATHHGHYTNFDEEQHKGDHFKNSKKIGDYHSNDQGSDSSWHQLNKVASVDRNEFERRSGKFFKLTSCYIDCVISPLILTKYGNCYFT